VGVAVIDPANDGAGLGAVVDVVVLAGAGFSVGGGVLAPRLPLGRGNKVEDVAGAGVVVVDVVVVLDVVVVDVDGTMQDVHVRLPLSLPMSSFGSQ